MCVCCVSVFKDRLERSQCILFNVCITRYKKWAKNVTMKYESRVVDVMVRINSSQHLRIAERSVNYLTI